MKRRQFLRTGSLALLASPACLSARSSVDEGAIERYCEVVRRVRSDWYPPTNPPSVPALALRAVSKDAPRNPYPIISDDFFDSLRGTIRFEAMRQGRPEFLIAEQSLHRFVSSLDPWSSYLDPGTWRQYQASQDPSYCGVGMDLEKEENGSFTCWPYPGSVAAAAGIKPGAKLTAVDGRAISGLSLYAIGALVRGPVARKVTLTVSGGIPGMGREISLFRRRAHSETVFIQQGSSTPSIRIARFSTGTAAQLAQNLRRLGSNGVEIDLRDCRGGDLDAAVECAGLFLKTGTRVGTIQRRTGSERLIAPAGAKVESGVLLLQNGNTASSAELFIRALTANQVAISSGPRTKGKATTQSVTSLNAGGAIVLTTGLITDPRGVTWHKSGLAAVR